MAPLIDHDRLALKRQSRHERRAQVLAAARTTLLGLPYARVTLETIGQRAGLRRGAAALFFPSLEELLLEVLGGELDEWGLALEGRLGAGRPDLDAAAVTELLASSLAGRAVLVRLLGLLAVVVERDPDLMVLVRFEQSRHRWMLRLGPALERRWPALGAGDGAVLLRRFQLLVAALAPAANPAGMTALALAEPGLEALRVDFVAELRCLTGMLTDSV